MEPFKIGDLVAGKYEITRVLGRGGMGVVVAARHRELGEDVALKFLRPSSTDSPESLARFAREARTATRIKSEHVARVFDVGTVDGGAPFIVMECLTGEDLAHVIKRRGPLPPAEAVDLLLQACEALAEAQEVTLAPALGESVDTAERRPMPRLVKLAIGAGGAALLLTAAVFGLRGLGSASPAATSIPAVTAVAPDAGVNAMTPAPSADAGARWRATPLTAKDVDLGDFAVAAPPSEDHPKGVVAALAFGEQRDETFVTVVAIDLADERVLASNPVGYAATGTVTDIASTPRGVVVAQQQKTGLGLQWFTSGTIDADSRKLPALAAKKDGDLRAFTTFGDRIVLATGATTSW